MKSALKTWASRSKISYNSEKPILGALTSLRAHSLLTLHEAELCLQQSSDLGLPHVSHLLGAGLEGVYLVLTVDRDLELQSVFVGRVSQIHHSHLQRNSDDSKLRSILCAILARKC